MVSRSKDIELNLVEVKKPISITTILYIIVISMGLLFRLGSFIQDRTLWYDEAMLASGIVQRGFSGLFTPLDYSQSAPIGFLLIVKTFITVLGSSQRVLRLYSFLTGLSSIWMFYLLIKRSGFKRPLIGAAFYATVSPLIYYSNELKPYMPDAFFTIAALYLYKLYEDKKVPVWAYLLFCICSVWISFPTIFVIGAITCYNFFRSIAGIIVEIISDNRENIKDKLGVLIGAAVFGGAALISFGICYITYTGKVSGNIDGMSMEYWKHLYFPLFPKKLSEWNLIYLMMNNYFSFIFGDIAALSVILWVGGILLLIVRRNSIGAYSVLAVLFTLVASSIEQYPIQDRLLLFLVPFTLLGILFFAEVLMDLLKLKAFEVVVFILLISLNYGSLKYTDVSNMYKEGQEAANLIYYLENKIEEDEKLYIFANAVPIYEYHTGYKQGLTHFPEKIFESGQLIYGSKYWNLKCEPYKYITSIDKQLLKENVDSIVKYQKAYVLFYHYGSDAEYYLISELRKYGTVTYFMNEKNTPLYYFVRYAHLN